MKRNIALFCGVFFAIFSFGQSSDVSAPDVVATPFITLGAPINCTLDATTPSGLPTLDAAPGSDDVFVSFVALTQGVKIDVQNADFDVVVEIWDDGVFKDGMNDFAGNADERLWIQDLVAGNTYVVRVYSVDGIGAGNFEFFIEHLPKVNLRDFYSPTNDAYDASDGVPGYRMNQSIGREILTPGFGFPANVNALIEGTQYRITNISTGDIHYKEVIGGGPAITLHTVSEGGILCPNETYTVEVQVMFEGNYCGYGDALEIFTEAEPVALIQAGNEGQIFELDGTMQMNYIGQGQSITWYYSTDNGDTQLDPFQEVANPANTWCALQQVSCLRYGKIYEASVQASYCGIVGPISEPITIYTVPYPKTRLVDADFYAGTIGPSDWISCEQVFKAEQYAFQFAEITPGDPNMIPISPAQMIYSSNIGTNVSSLGLVDGASYRVGVKSFIQLGDGCDLPQESDYGLFAELLVDDGVEPVDDLDDFSEDTDNGIGGNIAQNYGSKIENPRKQTKAFVVNANDYDLSGTGILRVFDINGREITERNIYQLEDADYLYYDLSEELATGAYIFSLYTSTERITQKIYIP